MPGVLGCGAEEAWRNAAEPTDRFGGPQRGPGRRPWWPRSGRRRRGAEQWSILDLFLTLGWLRIFGADHWRGGFAISWDASDCRRNGPQFGIGPVLSLRCSTYQMKGVPAIYFRLGGLEFDKRFVVRHPKSCERESLFSLLFCKAGINPSASMIIP